MSLKIVIRQLPGRSSDLRHLLSNVNEVTVLLKILRSREKKKHCTLDVNSTIYHHTLLLRLKVITPASARWY